MRECQRQARKQVERTQRQTDAAVHAQVEAAQRRAATDRLARVEEAVAQLPAVQALKDRQPKEKTPDGGAGVDDHSGRACHEDGRWRDRPGQLHLATDVDSRVIVGVQIFNSGADQSHLGPMLDAIAQRLGRLPAAQLLDGGFVTKAEITAAEPGRHRLCAADAARGADPPAGRAGDGDSPPCAWRARMTIDEAKKIYKARGATAEWVNADARTHRTLERVRVRGLAKVHTWALWIALATTCCAPWRLCRI